MGFDISRKFKLEVPGHGSFSLGPNDHVASGGEGHVYRKNGVGLKIWDDSERAVRDRMPERIERLRALRHPAVVAPEALAYDTKGKAVGFLMPFIDPSWALPLAFTNDWRAAEKFGTPESLAFAARMREAVIAVHGADVILGDPNELNILGVDRDPKYIDVDAWIPKGFTGDKVLPTILDRHAPAFSREADWFAWAVVTFQLMVGVHPYRGTHPGFARSDMTGRMIANASVFDASVRLSPATRPFDVIPAGLLAWYRAVFADGYRGVPPDPAATPATLHAVRQGTIVLPPGALSASEVWKASTAILRVVAPGLLMLDGGILVSMQDGRRYGTVHSRATCKLLPGGGVASAIIDGRHVSAGISPVGSATLPSYTDTGIAATAVWSADNRLFAIVQNGILELEIREVSKGTLTVPGRQWALNPGSTLFGDGAAIYDALGARHIVIPYNGNAVGIVRARALDDYRTLAIVRRGRVGVASLIDTAGAYHRAVITFGADYSTADIAIADADDGSLPDVITESGAIIRLRDDEIVASVPLSGAERTAPAAALVGTRLFTGPHGVFGLSGNTIAKLTLT